MTSPPSAGRPDAGPAVDPARVRMLLEAELTSLRAARPRSLAMLERARQHMPRGVPMSWMASDNDQPVYVDRGAGAHFWDLDGHRYTDFNASDMAMFGGHAAPAVVTAVQEQAARSTQFLLPTEDSVVVAEELARRYPVPQWQFTLSATQANTEAIRLARAATGRDAVVVFRGSYHGHFDEGLVDLDGDTPVPAFRGLARGVTGRVRVCEFNEISSVERALAAGDVAVVLTEPALTNNVHLVRPQGSWHADLRRVTRERGVVLAVDETHTHVVGPGGATALYGLEPDVVTIGKAVAGGVPMGAYGMTEELAERVDDDLATGGTLFGNPLSAAAARAALTQVLTPAAYVRAAALGQRLADGLQAAVERSGLPWTVIRFGPRSGQWYGPEPTTGRQALALRDTDLSRLLRAWMAGRGVWDALVGAGPTVPLPADEADVDGYVDAYADLLAALTR